MEAHSLLDVEFGTLVMGRLGELGEGFNKEIVNVERDIEVLQGNGKRQRVQ